MEEAKAARDPSLSGCLPLPQGRPLPAWTEAAFPGGAALPFARLQDILRPQLPNGLLGFPQPLAELRSFFRRAGLQGGRLLVGLQLLEELAVAEVHLGRHLGAREPKRGGREGGEGRGRRPSRGDPEKALGTGLRRSTRSRASAEACFFRLPRCKTTAPGMQRGDGYAGHPLAPAPRGCREL